jgi:hypothetical protein
MVKVTGPAMSLDAQKTIGKTLTYQRRPSGHSVYFKNNPGHRTPTVASVAQAARRVFVQEAIAAWNALTSSEKEEWNAFIVPPG